jgi:hypothetical protein
MTKNPKGPHIGKDEIVAALIKEGFNKTEASRAYEIMVDVMVEGLWAERPLFLKRLFKIWTQKMPPRRFWDNWNRRHVYFGERLVLKIKPLLFKRKPPDSMTVKMRAGRKPEAKK